MATRMRHFAGSRQESRASAAGAKADDLANELAAVARDDAATIADRQIVLNARDLDQKSLDGGDLAKNLMGRQPVELAQ